MPEAKKRLREFRAHFIDASLTGTGSPNFVRIGKDNDDINRTINYTTNTLKNVWGETQTSTTRENDEMDVAPFYIRKDEPLGQLLEKIDFEHLELDDLKRDYIEAVFDEDTIDTGITTKAFKQIADVVPVSAGGPSSDADNVPFRLAFSYKKIQGTFDMNTKTFTPAV